MSNDLATRVGHLVSPGASVGGDLRTDPYRIYQELREHQPVYRAPDGRWLVTSYDLCQRLLREEHWRRESGTPEQDMSLAVRVFMRSVVFRDPPDHTRLRRALAGKFTPKAVATYASIVERRTHEVLAKASELEEFDFRNGPAYELPVLVIGDLLGIPSSDVFEFDEWSSTLLHLDEHEHGGDGLAKANAAARQALDYFTDLIAHRRSHPGDDLVSALVSAQSDNDLSVEEIAGLCILLHIGGHSTTNDLIGNSLPHLLADRDAVVSLQANPALIDSAVEEMLRFDPVIQASLPRIAPFDIEFDGQQISAGDHVQAVLGAANRDPRHFVDPDRFDITRRDNHHLSFAAGIHFCLGAHLGRLEARTFYRQLLTEHPSIEMTVDHSELVYMDSFLHRGITSLPVRWQR